MTTEKLSQYEELIDQIMIDEVAGLDTELKAKLEGLSLAQKRIGILSILDKDRGLFMKILDVIKGNDVSKTDYIKTLVSMLREYVKVGDVEKKAFGEVMTPISLVNDMLDTLPKEVWSNPNLKWLDPCGGCGVFSSVIVERLMVGLDIYESDEERYRHIVENMLYVCELQPKNMFLHLVSFDPKDEYALNVYCGSYLDGGFDEHMRDVWGLEKFDVIVMNPPYNSGSSNRGSAHVLWDKFVIKTVSQLIEEGYLVAVHPGGWRNLDGGFKNVKECLLSKEIKYLNMNTVKQGFKTFGAYTDYDFYCIKNKSNNNIKTKIVDIDDEVEFINLSDKNFVPNCKLNKVYSLVAKNDEEKVNLVLSCQYHTQKDYVSKIKDDKFKYKLVQTVKKNGEPSLRYSSINNKGLFNEPKIMFGNGASGVLLDINGEYGQTEFGRSIIDEPKNLLLIKKAMENEFFIKYIMAFRDSFGDKYNRKIISTFRKDFWKEFI